MGLDMFLQVKNGDQEIVIGYWRKANAIHNWFVTHCASGVDECQPTPVTRENLSTLRGLCVATLHDPDTADANLPTRTGFFFGATDYDDYYLDDLNRTVAICDKALTTDYQEFIYRASW